MAGDGKGDAPAAENFFVLWNSYSTFWGSLSASWCSEEASLKLCSTFFKNLPLCVHRSMESNRR